jgi:hypothetical protein
MILTLVLGHQRFYLAHSMSLWTPCPCRRLYMHEFPDPTLTFVHPIDIPCCPLLQNQTLLQKRHILLPDLQCPPPFRATMTTSNKVAALPNPNLAIALAGISRSETSACPSCRSSVLSYTTKSNSFLKNTHFALRSTMSTSIGSDYDNVEQSCNASKP